MSIAAVAILSWLLIATIIAIVIPRIWYERFEDDGALYIGLAWPITIVPGIITFIFDKQSFATFDLER